MAHNFPKNTSVFFLDVVDGTPKTSFTEVYTAILAGAFVVMRSSGGTGNEPAFYYLVDASPIAIKFMDLGDLSYIYTFKADNTLVEST